MNTPTSDPDDSRRASMAGASDALEHFWSAAHEFLSAMRALVDAADAYVEAQREHAAHDEPRVHRIDIE